MQVRTLFSKIADIPSSTHVPFPLYSLPHTSVIGCVGAAHSFRYSVSHRSIIVVYRPSKTQSPVAVPISPFSSTRASPRPSNRTRHLVVAFAPSQFGITELIVDSGRTDWITNPGGSDRGLSWSRTWAELFAEMTRTGRERAGKMSAKESQPDRKMSRTDCRRWRRGKCGCHVIRLFCSTASLST
jgi:hypothetical protein